MFLRKRKKIHSATKKGHLQKETKKERKKKGRTAIDKNLNSMNNV